MKKILFASTALVATAGVAAADIDFTGSAGMGFGFVDDRASITGNVDDKDWQLITSTTLSVAMTGETDGGLSFGAEFDITAGEGGIDEEVVYIEGGFGKLSAGDVDSASQTVTGLSDIGFDGLGTDNIAEALRGSNDDIGWDGIAASILYEKSVGEFSGAISYDLAAETVSIGGKYDNGSYSFALGYDDHAATGVVHIQAGANISDIKVDALYSTTTASGVDLTSYGITAAYTMGEATVTAAYSEIDAGGSSIDAYGLGVSYDLGGGATLDAGVAEVAGVTVADMGINMSF